MSRPTELYRNCSCRKPHLRRLLIDDGECVLTEEEINVVSNGIQYSKMAVWRERHVANLLKQVLGSINKRQVLLAIPFGSSGNEVAQLLKEHRIAFGANGIVDSCVPHNGTLTEVTQIFYRLVNVVLQRSYIPLVFQLRKR